MQMFNEEKANRFAKNIKLLIISIPFLLLGLVFLFFLECNTSVGIMKLRNMERNKINEITIEITNNNSITRKYPNKYQDKDSINKIIKYFKTLEKIKLNHPNATKKIDIILLGDSTFQLEVYIGSNPPHFIVFKEKGWNYGNFYSNELIAWLKEKKYIEKE